jgi:hypothetical protein
MSGGHDDCRYLYSSISEAARYVRDDIRKKPVRDEYGNMLTPNSKALNMVYADFAAELERASIMYKAVDYCESGDTSEDDVLMDYWNYGYAQTAVIRAAILERLEELSQESRWHSYSVWAESGKRLENYSLRCRGGYCMSEIRLTYKDDDGIEQQKNYASWEDYESEITCIKEQLAEPTIRYDLVNDKIVRTRT